MGITELERVRTQERLNSGREALGRTLQHAFPISECRSFRGLMNAIDPDRRAPAKERQAFLWRSDQG